MLLFFAIIFIETIVKVLFWEIFTNQMNFLKKNVLVYGAGEAGRQLVISLENSPEFKVVGFLDDNQHLHKQVLLGQTIYSPKYRKINSK